MSKLGSPPNPQLMMALDDDQHLQCLLKYPKLRVGDNVETVKHLCEVISFESGTIASSQDDRSILSLLEKAFAPCSSKSTTSVAGADLKGINQKLNILALYCVDNCPEAAVFNEWYMTARNLDSSLPNSVHWKMLQIFRKTYWIDPNTTFNTFSLPLVLFIEELNDLRHSVTSAFAMVSLVRLIFCNEVPEEPVEFSRISKFVPYSIKVLLSNIRSRMSKSDLALSPWVSLPREGYSWEKLQSSSFATRLIVSKVFDIDPVDFQSLDPEKHLTEFACLMTHLEGTQYQRIWAESSKNVDRRERNRNTAACVMNQAFEMYKVKDHSWTILQRRKIEIIMNSYARILLSPGEKGSKFVDVSGNKLTLIASAVTNYMYCRNHLSVEGVCCALSKAALSNVELSISEEQIYNFLRKSLRDSTNSTETKCSVIHAASNLCMKFPFLVQRFCNEDWIDLVLGLLEFEKHEDLFNRSIIAFLSNLIYFALDIEESKRSKASEDVTINIWTRLKRRRVSLPDILMCDRISSCVKKEVVKFMGNSLRNEKLDLASLGFNTSVEAICFNLTADLEEELKILSFNTLYSYTLRPLLHPENDLRKILGLFDKFSDGRALSLSTKALTGLGILVSACFDIVENLDIPIAMSYKMELSAWQRIGVEVRGSSHELSARSSFTRISQWSQKVL